MSFQQGNPNSDTAELALGVLLDSGIMLPGSRISDYQARPEAQRWLRMLPTVWDETTYVSGDPLTGGVVARRSGDRWFVGALRHGGGTAISYPTTFLGSGAWHAENTTDGPDGLTRTSKVIQAGDTLSVPAGRQRRPCGQADQGRGPPDRESHGDHRRQESRTRREERKPRERRRDHRLAQHRRRQPALRVRAPGRRIHTDRQPGQRQGRVNRHSGLHLTAGNAQGDQLEQRPFDGADHQMFTVS
ncbi:hypothetical protein QFZ56_007922 [Streptomyces achromogenes]|uniref:Glycosyl-hydrolase 97 C-terminal oligomerisation domain-containing protein n=1 Tax=Streptomyces achromogenes TaxID=67255 RepID=A0ABU0QE71_STRAH|nr:hypothetical protein [Streptomyces achromogenes]